MTLDVDSNDMPLMPWPDVQPPAILDPTTMKKPPAAAKNGLTLASPGLARCGDTYPTSQEPLKTPRENRIEVYFCTPPPRMADQNHSPISSYEVDTPISDFLSRRDSSCAPPTSKPPTIGCIPASGPVVVANAAIVAVADSNVSKPTSAVVWLKPSASCMVSFPFSAL